ncbi:MAG: LPS export ABC transporter periplasmic protein LptC [Bacteroidota bacterium]
MIFAVVWVALAGCAEPDIATPSLQEIQQGPLPDQESWFTQFNVIDGGKPRMQIHADYMAKFESVDSTYMILEGHPDSLGGRVLAYLFDEKGDSSATILADQMVYFENERRIESIGNVIVNTTDEKKLETEFLIWHEIDRRVKTDGFVRITTPREDIQGYNLDADEDLENYEIARVTGQALVDDI